MKKLSVEQVLDVVADYYQLCVYDLLGTDRRERIANPRAVAMYFARTHTSQSYPELGRRFHRHHTTVLHAVQTVTAKLKDSSELWLDFGRIDQQLKTLAGEEVPTTFQEVASRLREFAVAEAGKLEGIDPRMGQTGAWYAGRKSGFESAAQFLEAKESA